MALQLPREPRPGGPLDPSWGTQIVRYLRAITPRSSAYVRVNTLANGTVFDVTVRSQAAGSSAPPRTHPFQVIDATDDDGAKVRVVFGMASDVPSTIGTDYLDQIPPPSLEVTTSGVIYLDMTIHAATGEPTTCEVKNAAVKPANTNSKAYVTLATIAIAGDTVTAIAQVVTHSLYVRRCGNTSYDIKAV